MAGRTLAVGILLCICACESGSAPPRASDPKGAGTPVAGSTVELAIGGMSCDSCTPAVKGVLKKVDGVLQVEVLFEEKKAVVVHDPARTAPEALVAAVNGTRIFTARVVEPAVPDR